MPKLLANDFVRSTIAVGHLYIRFLFDSVEIFMDEVESVV